MIVHELRSNQFTLKSGIMCRVYGSWETATDVMYTGEWHTNAAHTTLLQFARGALGSMCMTEECVATLSSGSVDLCFSMFSYFKRH